MLSKILVPELALHEEGCSFYDNYHDNHYSKANQLDPELHNNLFMNSPDLALKVIMFSVCPEIIYWF